MTLIDTSAWIEFFRRSGEPHIKSRVASYLDVGDSAICGPIEFELLAGARRSETSDIRTAVSFCTMLDFTPECWRRAAHLERALRRKGVKVPRDDIFVAAASIEHGVPVYAHDAHFELMRKKGGQKLQLR
ncbi:MAG: PIN domain-containing protein [Proteobacteria bacterium]|nr:PIN domain-containing protein [Pseudomonadota bacterium]